jgi:hypothetical protein
MNFGSLLNRYATSDRSKVKKRPSAPKEKKRILKVFFVHVPKTAGSAVKQAFRKATGAFEAEEWKLTADDGTIVHIVARGHTDAAGFPKDAFKFATIREPLSRFMSAYSFVREGGRNHPNQKAVGQARKWAPFLLQFDTFAKFMQSTDAISTIMDPLHGHTHFHHLEPWVCSSGELNVDFVIRQNSVESDFEALCSMLRLEGLRIPQNHNKTGKKFNLHESDRPDLQKIFRDDIRLYDKIMSAYDDITAKAKAKLANLFGELEAATEPRHSSHSGARTTNSGPGTSSSSGNDSGRGSNNRRLEQKSKARSHPGSAAVGTTVGNKDEGDSETPACKRRRTDAEQNSPSGT